MPSGFQHTFVALGMMALMAIVNTFGTDVIAAYTVASRIDSLAVLPVMNIAAALSVFVGQNIGANKFSRIRSGLNASMVISVGISLLMGLVAILWAKPLMGLFTNDPVVVAIGRDYLIIVSIFYPVFSAMFTYNGLLRGAGATLVPMFITLLSLWVIRIPLAWLLSRTMAEQGIWWSIPIAWLVGLVGALIYYRYGAWRHKGVVNTKLDEL